MDAAPAPLVFADGLAPLVRERRGVLLGVARREGLATEDAFDCVQEALLTLVTSDEGRALLDRPDEAARWVTVVVRNLARNRRRRHEVARPHERELDELPDDEPGAESLLTQAAEREDVHACVHRLEALQRSVITLRLLDERPGESVAGELGLSPNHVAVLLYRAKASLRRCLEERRAALDLYP